MKISAIVAIASNGAIGKGNDLIWRLPNDLKYFKKITSGHHIIMGRKNYESIGRPLPNRTNVVITRNESYREKGVEVCHSLEGALKIAEANGETEVFIIGGAQIYEMAMPIIDTLYLTEVHQEFEGDVFFQPDLSHWKEISREDHQADDKHLCNYSFVTYQRQ